jgi:hypothetical protein
MHSKFLRIAFIIGCIASQLFVNAHAGFFSQYGDDTLKERIYRLSKPNQLELKESFNHCMLDEIKKLSLEAYITLNTGTPEDYIDSALEWGSEQYATQFYFRESNRRWGAHGAAEWKSGLEHPDYEKNRAFYKDKGRKEMIALVNRVMKSLLDNPGRIGAVSF